MAKKKTGVKLGLKNLGIESGSEATGLEDIFGIAPTEAPSKKPKRTAKKAAQPTDTGRPTFGEIDILAARPDADQPRSLLPTNAYSALDQGADPVAVLNDWLSARSSTTPAQQEEMDEIIALAETIEEAGLQQPIGIRESDSFVKGVDFAVVFGERRWWAHIYLLSADNSALGQEVGKIRAGLVQPDNLQLVQLIENLHRRNLPPLDIAEGLRKSFDQLKASGVKSPGQKLEKATGIKREHRSRYLHLLELTPAVQQKIRDHGLTENSVRPIAYRLRKESPDKQLKAINTLISWRAKEQPSGPKQLNQFIDGLLTGQTSSAQQAPRVGSGGMSTMVGPILSKAKATQKVINKLDSATAYQLRIYLNEEPVRAMDLVTLRNQLNQLLNDIAPGRVFLVRINNSYVELATDKNVAPGFIAYESYLEAAAEATKGGEVEEFELGAARELASSRQMALWIATVDGQTVQG